MMPSSSRSLVLRAVDRRLGRLAPAGCCALLIACSSSAAVRAPQATTAANTTARDARFAPKAPAPPATAQASACTVTTLHFPVDSAVLDDAILPQMGDNLACVQRLRARKLEIVGMADPRGTEEYNLALGNRRAHAVADYFARAGVSASLLVRSLGEEVATGTDEAGWAHDRRAEIHLE